MTDNSNEALKKRAEARFRHEERVIDGRKAMTEYQAQALATLEKTARLKAVRLDKEAQAQNEEPPPKQPKRRANLRAIKPSKIRDVKLGKIVPRSPRQEVQEQPQEDAAPKTSVRPLKKRGNR